MQIKRRISPISYPSHAQNVISPFRTLTISCVACILMHDQITHGTLFTLSGIHDFVRSVHLDARTNHTRNVKKTTALWVESAVDFLLILNLRLSKAEFYSTYLSARAAQRQQYDRLLSSHGRHDSRSRYHRLHARLKRQLPHPKL